MALVPESSPLAPSGDLETSIPADESLRRQLEGLLAFIVQRVLASPVTLTLMAACVVLDLLSRRWGPGAWRALALWHMGEGQWTAVLDGEFHRVLAAVFLHRDANHLVNNMRALFVTGLLIEPAVGARRTLLLYVVCCLAGTLCYLPEAREVRSLGASGGITGLVFAAVGFRMRFLRPFPLPLGKLAFGAVQLGVLIGGGALAFSALARSRAVLYIALLVGVAAESRPPRNVAHLGGALAGMLLSYALVIRPRHMQKAAPHGLSLLSLWAGVAFAAASASIGVAIGTGQPWRIKDEPRFATVLLENTAFAAELPQLAGTARKVASSGLLHFFDYGSLQCSPLSLTITVSRKTWPGSAEEYVTMRRKLESEEELGDSERRRLVRSTQVGDVPAVRVDSEQSALHVTSIGLQLGGFAVQVSGYRQPWAAQENPPVWDGIEERVAASLRIVGK